MREEGRIRVYGGDRCTFVSGALQEIGLLVSCFSGGSDMGFVRKFLGFSRICLMDFVGFGRRSFLTKAGVGFGI